MSAASAHDAIPLGRERRTGDERRHHGIATSKARPAKRGELHDDPCKPFGTTGSPIPSPGITG